MGDQAFFQIAVGLIPVFLFGGFLFSRRSASDLRRPFRVRDGLAFVAIGVLGFLTIVAEAIAIGGAVGAEPTVPGKILVIAVILLGMLLVVVDALWPRARHMLSNVSRSEAGWARFALGLLLLALIATAAYSAVQVDQAIRIGQDEANVEEAERLQGKIETIRHREERRRRRTNSLYFEWQRLLGQSGRSRVLTRLHLREVKDEIRAEERAGREDLEHLFELERKIRELDV